MRGVAFRSSCIGSTVARQPGESLEAAARTARFAAFAGSDADVIALAHHADDQAETLLLQLLRGAGPKGLAAMPACRQEAGRPVLARPFLALSRAEIVESAQGRRLEWIDDESNDDTDVRRNFLRHEIAPRLAQAFPGYPGTLVRAARHQAEAALLADELAAHDAHGAIAEDPLLGTTLSRESLAMLARAAPHRARNLLRWFLRKHGLRAPSSARLAAMLDQLAHAAPDARVTLAHDGVVLGIHRGRIGVHSPPVARFALPWHGENAVELPHGVLEFAPAYGAGLAAAALGSGAVTIRSRVGGERIRLGEDRSRSPPEAIAAGSRHSPLAARRPAARLVRRGPRRRTRIGHRGHVPQRSRRPRIRIALASASRPPSHDAGAHRRRSLTRINPAPFAAR